MYLFGLSFTKIYSRPTVEYCQPTGEHALVLLVVNFKFKVYNIETFGTFVYELMFADRRRECVQNKFPIICKCAASRCVCISASTSIRVGFIRAKLDITKSVLTIRKNTWNRSVALVALGHYTNQ